MLITVQKCNRIKNSCSNIFEGLQNPAPRSRELATNESAPNSEAAPHWPREVLASWNRVIFPIDRPTVIQVKNGSIANR